MAVIYNKAMPVIGSPAVGSPYVQQQAPQGNSMPSRGPLPAVPKSGYQICYNMPPHQAFVHSGVGLLHQPNAFVVQQPMHTLRVIPPHNPHPGHQVISPEGGSLRLVSTLHPSVGQHLVTAVSSPSAAASPPRIHRSSAPTLTSLPSFAHVGESKTVSIGSRSFQCIRELGSGSFGVVWEVKEQLSHMSETPSLALKKTSPNKKELLEACLLEAEVLQKLAQALPSDLKESRCVPRYVAHCVVSSSSSFSQVMLAMSKLEGRPLDQWLYGVDEHKLKTIRMEDLLDGPLPNGQRSTRTLKDASDTAAALLSQMTPVFGALTKIAYHRDVSAHNFLISELEKKGLQFSVLDFGLAVRAPAWHNEWQERNIAGDPRYFTPSAWMQLTFGYKYLEAHPDQNFMRHYTHRLDHYSFGILISEVLFALWKGPNEVQEDDYEDKEKQWRSALKSVRTAWRSYWTQCVGLFQKFHSIGAVRVRQHLASSQAIHTLVDGLKSLVKELKEASEKATGCGFEVRRVGLIFKAIAGLIDWKSKFGWEDLRLLLVDLRSISAERRVSRTRSRAFSTVSQVEDQNLSSCEQLSNVSSPTSAALARAIVLAEELTKDDAKQEQEGSKDPEELDTPSQEDKEETTSGSDFDVDEAKESAEKRLEEAKKAEEEAALLAAQSRPRTKSWHRRVWTVDASVELLRGVTEVGVGQTRQEIIPE